MKRAKSRTIVMPTVAVTGISVPLSIVISESAPGVTVPLSVVSPEPKVLPGSPDLARWDAEYLSQPVPPPISMWNSIVGFFAKLFAPSQSASAIAKSRAI